MIQKHIKEKRRKVKFAERRVWRQIGRTHQIFQVLYWSLKKTRGFCVENSLLFLKSPDSLVIISQWVSVAVTLFPLGFDPSQEPLLMQVMGSCPSVLMDLVS